MSHWRRSALFAGVAFFIGGVLCGQQQTLQSLQLPPAASGAAQDPDSKAYKLEAGDTVEIRFFFNPELNDTVQIRPDGRISLQLAGEIDVAGKTIADATNDIQARYRTELKTPKVSIQVRNYAGQKVYVTGEVQRPGTIGLPGEMSVIAAISDAGGIKTTGNRDRIVLVRKGPDGNPLVMPLLLRTHGKITPEAYTMLRPFDVVMVPESHISRADRWVDQYIKQLMPGNLSAGFTYLYNTTSVAGLPL